MDESPVPSSGLGVPSWFGKLPGMGDFARRRLQHEFLDPWDAWLQTGLGQLRSHHPDWVTSYLRAPLWYFVLGEHVIGTKPWVGVMMPSVDSVGRYFPLTLAQEISDPYTLRSSSFHEELAWWWSRCAQHAYTALENNLDATSFDQRLIAEFSEAWAATLIAPKITNAPQMGYSSWYADHRDLGLVAYELPGLPSDDSFAVLFGHSNQPTDTLETLPAALMDNLILGKPL